MAIFYTDSGSFNSLQVTGSTTISASSGIALQLKSSGSTILSISGSGGEIFNISDASSTNLFSVSSGSLTIFSVNNSKSTNISGSLTVTGSLNVTTGITGSLLGTSSYATQALSSSYFSGSVTSASFATTASYVSSNFQYEIHVSQIDGNDTTGDGSLLKPVASITKALTLTTAQRRVIVLHPGGYTENPTISSGNITIQTTELTGGNTVLSGTLTIPTSGSGARISGFSMDNLAITETAQAYVSNCTVNNNVIKSSSGYVEIINSELQCISGIQISGAGITIINGNKNVGVAVSNASAQVIIKGCNSVVTPSASAGNLAIVDCIVTALGGNGITITGASTTLTLLNSQVLVQAGNSVAPISVAGIYSIINTIYDKPGSTLTGTSTNSVDYFQYIDADNITTKGLTVTGSINVSGSVNANNFTGSLLGTSSWAQNSITSSYVQNAQTASYVLNAVSSSFASTALTSSYIQTAQTASYVTSSAIVGTVTSASYALTSSYVLNAISSSFATTASYALNSVGAAFPYTGSAEITGSLGITGSLNNGLNNIAPGLYSHAEGGETIADGNYSHAEGRNTQALGAYSHAEGEYATAGGAHSHAEGANTFALGGSSHAEGTGTYTYGDKSHAEGSETTAIGQNSHAEGSSTLTGGNAYSCSISDGFVEIDASQGDLTNTFTDGITILFGDTFTIGASVQQGIVTGSLFNGTNTTFQLLNLSSTIATAGILDKNGNLPNQLGGNTAHAEGSGTTALGDFSHAEGSGTTSYGAYSHAEGNGNSFGDFSHAEGSSTSVGQYSHAEGAGTTLANNSHAEGNETISGYKAYSANITAGVVTFERYYNDLSAIFSPGTKILVNDFNQNSVIIHEVDSVTFTGGETLVTLVDTSYDPQITLYVGIQDSPQPPYADLSFGDYSHAEGFQTTTLGYASHTAGLGTIAYGYYQSVIGQYNAPVEISSSFVIGDGTDTSNRHNLLVASSGSVNVSGSINSTSITTTEFNLSGSQIETAWTSYSPTWTTDDVTQPSLGDGTLTGAYKQIGKTVFVRVKLIYGSTTSGGTGAFLFSLPISASDASGVQFPCSILNSGNAWYGGIANGAYSGFADKTAIITSQTSSNVWEAVTSTFPITFGDLDSLQFNGSYEIA